MANSRGMAVFEGEIHLRIFRLARDDIDLGPRRNAGAFFFIPLGTVGG
jgi:hypothetical protein